LFFAISILGMVILILSEWMTLGQVEGDIVRIKQDLNLYGPQYKNVLMLEQEQADINQKREQILSVMKPFIPIENILGEVNISLPDKVWLKSIAVDENGKVIIDGRTNRMNAVALYMMDLEASPLIKNTHISNLSNETSKGIGDVFDFQMTFETEKVGSVK
jgi:Tfp pilus assembly protein PilN